MTDTPVFQVACVCGQRFDVLSQHVGMSLKCSCGRVARLPQHNPDAAGDVVALDALGPDEADATPVDLIPCAICTTPNPPDEIVCVHCGLDKRTGRMAEMRIEDPELPAARDYARTLRRGGWLRVQHIELPIAIMAVGLILRMFWAPVKDADGETFSIGTRFLIELGHLAMRAGFMVGAMYLIQFIAGANIGSWPIAMLKCGATFMMLRILALTVGDSESIVGIWMMLIIKLPVYYFMLRMWFEVEEFTSTILMVGGIFMMDVFFLLYTGQSIY